MLEMRSRSFLLAIFSVVCKLFVAVEQPTITLKEGLPAKIPCMVKGVADAYFWRKGKNLNISDEIATIVFGVPGVVSDAFRVTEDGTLMIYKVTSAIEGRYFCRISTKDNEYYSDVLVLVQVLFDDFGFGIEQCYPKETCTLQVEPYTTTNLTCTATGVPSSLSLKWYNGSDVITSVASEHSSNEESSTVSETITVPNEFGLPLTCEAVASEDGQACARLAHVRLNKTDTAKEHTDADKSSARWIIPLVLLIVAIVVIIVFLLKIIYEKKGKYAQKKKRFTTTTGQQEKELGEKDALIEKKGGELKKLQDELQDAKIALEAVKNDLTAENMTLKDAKIALEAVKNDLTAENMTLKDAIIAPEAVKKDLTAENMTLKDANIALEAVKKDLTAENMTLKTANGDLKEAQEDLTAKNKKLTTANGDLKKAQEDLTAKNEKLTTANGDLKKAQESLTAKNKKLTDGAGGQ